MQQGKRDLFFWYSLFIGLSLFTYVVARAFAVDITYDEAWTLSSFVSSSFADIFSFTNCDANNHLLNTVLIRCLYLNFENTVFLARLPNVLAALLYFYSATRFSAQLSGSLRFLSLSLLLFNPFLLEFFSLARGYGLGLAFVMWALYNYKKYFDTNTTQYLLKALLGLLLASMAMFSALHMILPAYGLLFLRALSSTQNRKKHLLSIVLTVALNVAMLWLPIKQLRANDSLYYGGHNNFFTDTVLSLSKYFVAETYAGPFLQVVSAFIVVLGVLLIVWPLARLKKTKMQSQAIALLFTLTVLSVIAQFYILHTPYVTDRTALFFYPLFCTALTVALMQWQDNKGSSLITAAICTLLLLNFGLCCNTYKTQTWFFNAHGSEIVEAIKKDAKQNTCSAQLSWPLRKSIEYYRDRNFKNLSLEYKDPQIALRDGDYVVFIDGKIDQVDYQAGYDVLTQYPKDTLLNFEKEHLYLFKLKVKH